MLEFEVYGCKESGQAGEFSIRRQINRKATKDLDVTVKLVDELANLNLSSVEPTSQVTGLTNVMRKDEIDNSRILPITGYFKVKAIFNEP